MRGPRKLAERPLWAGGEILSPGLCEREKKQSVRNMSRKMRTANRLKCQVVKTLTL